MAVVNRSSTAITNQTATPPVKNPVEGPQVKRNVVGYVANAADDDANSVHRFVRVPSNARIESAKLTTGDASSAGAFNLGIWQTAENGGAVVDADLFASAFALTNGPYSAVELKDESGEYTVLEQTKMLWEVLGLTADPKIEYDIATQVSTTYNGAAVGQLLSVDFTI